MTENNNPKQDKPDQITDHSQFEYNWERDLENHDLLQSDFKAEFPQMMDAYSFIKERCNEYSGNKPLELAVEIMNHPVIRMHGGEHHYLTPAVLLTVYNNLTHKYPDKLEKLNELEKFIKENAPISCSLEAGTCGAAIGSSIFFKYFVTDQLPIEELDRLSEYVRIESIKQIDEIGLSRCCKRDTYISLIVTSKVLRNNLDLDIILSEPKCTFSLRNRSCGMEDCPFYNLGYLIG